MSLLGIDLDHANEAALAKALGKVEGYRHVAHATHSDRPGDRCVRIIVALSRQVTREEWRPFWTAAMRFLDIPADRQCNDANRIYFLPSRPADSEYLFRSADGVALDVDAMLARVPAEPPRPTLPPPGAKVYENEEHTVRRARAYLDKMPPAISGQGGHTALFEATAAMMFGFDLDESTTRRLISEEYNPRCQPPWSEGEIEHKLASVRDDCKLPVGYIRDAPAPDESTWHTAPPERDDDADHVTEDPHGGAPLDEMALPPAPSAKPPARPKLNPVKVARRFVAEHATHDDGVTLRRWRGDWYRWTAERGCYGVQSDERIDATLYVSMGLTKRTEVGDVRHALIAVDDVLIDETELGAWIGEHAAGAPALDVVACRNGLLHLPTGTLTPPTPRYFTTTALPLDYDEAAPAPERWLAFLAQLWSDDETSITALQEWIGYLLTPDTRQQKIAMLIGPKRSGKGTIARIVGALLGATNVASPTLASLGTNFGMWPLIGKPAAIIGDARLGGRSDVAQVVERLLSVSGADNQTIDRKHREPWTGTLPTRFTIISNEIPRFNDASDALPSRMLMLELTRTWFNGEDTTLTDKLLAELPGILRWAVEGWRRLRARGHFAQPATSAAAIAEMADLASPVGAWARERCSTSEPDPAWWLTCDAAYDNFRQWCEANGHHRPSQTTFGVQVRAATGCHRKQVRRGPAKVNVYTGLALRSDR